MKKCNHINSNPPHDADLCFWCQREEIESLRAELLTKKEPKPKAEVSVEKYTIRVTGSALERVHGFHQIITEYCLPDQKICFNFAAGRFNAFRFYKQRYDQPHTQFLGRFTLPQDYVDKIVSALEAQEDLNESQAFVEQKTQEKETS